MKRFRVVIIGGGIAGAGLAAAISEHSEVTLLEQESRAGYHSTGRSAAIYIESYGNDVIRLLNAASESFFRHPTTIGGGSLLRRRGVLSIATDEDGAELDSQLSTFPKLRELRPSEAMAKVPVLRADRFSRALYEEGASDIDVDRLHQGWLGQAKAAGARVILNSMVTGISRQQNLWIIESRDTKHPADVIVNASGAWADSIARMAGVTALSLKPLRRSAAIVRLAGDVNVANWPLVGDIKETWYAKPEAGQLMVSPGDEDPVPAGDAWVDDHVLAAGIDRFESMITTEVSSVGHRWAGLRTFAPDKTPVVGYDADHDGFFWLAGHGGYGIQTSPALSALAGDLLLGKPIDKGLESGLSPSRTMIDVKGG